MYDPLRTLASLIMDAYSSLSTAFYLLLCLDLYIAPSVLGYSDYSTLLKRLSFGTIMKQLYIPL